VPRKKGSYFVRGVYLIPISGGQVERLQGCLEKRGSGPGAYSPQISGNRRSCATRGAEHEG
jgi:hypothetical protein